MSAASVLGFLEGPAHHTDTLGLGRALVRDDPRQDLEQVTCPCLVLWGARDHWVPLRDGVEYARRLRAPLRTIADCGHLLIGERPDACLDAIWWLLERVDRGYDTAASSNGVSAAASRPSGGERN